MHEQKYPAELNKLNKMLDFIMNILDKMKVESQLQKKIYIISEEALTNIIKHAYPVTIEEGINYLKIIIYVIKKTDLVLIFQDHGIEYNFNNITKGNFKETGNNGMGVFLIKKFADHTEYIREKNLNKLKVVIKNVL